MPTKRINIYNNDKIHFITLTINHWYYIFDRHNRWNILADSFKYCQEHKALKIYAYVFMLNHIHLIIQNPDVAGFLRDFKKYTAFTLMKNLRKTEPLVAKLFEQPEGKYQIWAKSNMPILLESEEVYQQKKEYIEQNPVVKNYVMDPSYWHWSSANSYSPIHVSQLS
jgi:putative transposase